MRPTISILMPILNRERYLPAALESLLAQTFQDWELILADGGSTDRTVELLQQYAKRDPRIHFFSVTVASLAESRNFTLEKAQGEFVAILDSDDVACPERLTRQLTFLETNPDLLGVGTNFTFIDADGNPLILDKYKQRLTDPAELRQRQQEGWSCFMHTSMLFRRDAMKKAGGYRNVFRLAEDDDFFLRLLEQGDLANMPEVLIRYRWHGDNTTGSLASHIHRAAALASAHLRLAGLPDIVNLRNAPIDYQFLLELLRQLGDAALPVWLMWLGLLQHYRLGEAGMIEEAWRNVFALPFKDTMAGEIIRHWRTCQNAFPDTVTLPASIIAGSIGAWLVTNS